MANGYHSGLLMIYSCGQSGFVSRPMALALGSVALVAVLVGLLVWSPRHDAALPRHDPLILYCTTNMARAVQQIASRYEQQYGQPIQLELGGSGTLLSQLRLTPGRGHLYLAGDLWYIDQACGDGLIQTVLPIARITPVIVTQPNNPMQINSLDDLITGNLKLVLANPDLASIGRTTQELFEQANLWHKIEKLRSGRGAIVSMVGTVNEVAQAIKLSAADAGVVWDVTATQFDLHTVADSRLASGQSTNAIAVLNGHQRKDDALRFARYLATSDTSRALLRAHGFAPIGPASTWQEQADDE